MPAVSDRSMIVRARRVPEPCRGPVVTFGLCVVLFQFANAPLLPLVGQKARRRLSRGSDGHDVVLHHCCTIGDAADRAGRTHRRQLGAQALFLAGFPSCRSGQRSTPSPVFALGAAGQAPPAARWTKMGKVAACNNAEVRTTATSEKSHNTPSRTLPANQATP
jgi:hypothetical protein